LPGGAPQLNCVPHSSQVSFCIGTAPVTHHRIVARNADIHKSKKGDGLHQPLVL